MRALFLQSVRKLLIERRDSWGNLRGRVEFSRVLIIGYDSFLRSRLSFFHDLNKFKGKLDVLGKSFIAVSMVVVLASCTTLKPNAEQPTSGPRARIRLAAFAGELSVLVTQPDGRPGTLYARSGFYPGKSDLGMPKGATGRPGNNEYYVVGNQDIVARSAITRVPSSASPVASHCEVAAQIHVDAGKDYEISVVTGQGAEARMMTSCFITATQLVIMPDGRVGKKPVRVSPVAIHGS